MNSFIIKDINISFNDICKIINEDLAGMVGSARQWIIATLDKFQTAGAICYVDCKILILKSDWFRKKSGM